MYYAVSLFYKSDRTDSNSPLWEERIVLVSALDKAEAELKALSYSNIEETQYNTADSISVSWKFVKVERVYEINDDLKDGTELFSRFLRSHEAKSILTNFEN